MNLHDTHYRKLFSSPHMVRALFHGILPAPLRAMVDLDTLEPLPTSYISAFLQERRSDLVWRVRRRDGIMLYLLILLEHQSGADRIMGIRFMSYSSLLYEDISIRGLVQPPQRLPLVLPILLYSGERRWNAPTQVSDLVDTPPPGLRPYQPDMRYLVVDEGAMVAQDALPADNLAGLLFRLEHCQGIAQAQELLHKVLQLTHQPQYDELRRAFGSWVRHVLFSRTLPQATKLARTDDLQEISAMLAARSRNWSENLRQEGAIHMLEQMLTRKFGPLPEPVRQRLHQADVASLETWALNFVEAQRLDEVFQQ